MSHGRTDPKAIAGLDINSTDDGYIVYQPELDRVHCLNHSLIEIACGTGWARRG
jgi:hypothetical protein